MKQFKKIAVLGLALAMSVSLLAACSGGSGTAATPAPETAAPETTAPETTPADGLVTVEAGKLHMSTNAAFPPYEMVKDDGTFEGIDVEVAAAI